VLAAGDGAQEVARELLGATVQVLDRIIERLRDPHPDPETLAGDVTTVFNNQRLFNESVRDFYAYLNAVLSPVRPRRRRVPPVQGAPARVHRPHHSRCLAARTGDRDAVRADLAKTRSDLGSPGDAACADHAGWDTRRSHARSHPRELGAAPCLVLRE
jgi:hypothetical protein